MLIQRVPMLRSKTSLLMSNPCIYFFSVIVVMLSIPTSLHAQLVPFGYVRPLAEDQFVIRANSHFFSSREEFSFSGIRQPLFTKDLQADDDLGVVDAYFNLYSGDFQYEYGVLPFLTVGGSLSYLYAVTGYVDVLILRENVRYSSSGFSEMWLWGRLGIFNNPAAAITLQFAVKAPTGDQGSRIPTGNGSFDYELTLQSMLNLLVGEAPLYLLLDGGYRLRTGEFSNQLPFRFEAGLGASAEILIRAGVRGIYGVDDFSSPNGLRFVSDQSLERRIQMVGDEAVLSLNLGLTAFVTKGFELFFDYGYRLFGNQTFSGESFRLGFAIR